MRMRVILSTKRIRGSVTLTLWRLVCDEDVCMFGNGGAPGCVGRIRYRDGITTLVLKC